MFDHPPGGQGETPDDDATPEPVALDSLAMQWQVLVGRDRRPAGVRIEMRHRAEGTPPPLSSLLDSVVRAFVEDDTTPFPHGMVLLSPVAATIDAAMASWKAPRNVLLEIPATDLQDEARVRILFESRGQGLRQALRVQENVPSEARLSFFQYVVGPSTIARWASIPVLATDSDTPARAASALGNGAHLVVGWPLTDPMAGKERELSPSQRAIFEVVRLVQADAEIRALEQVFEAEPLLAYMLLTLANSVAFRRGAPTASLRQAITSIGYQRLIKWLILILAISSKEGPMAPLIFTTLIRGYCMENLCLASHRPKQDADECFIVGAFSLLDAITGQSLPSLLGEAGLPAPIVDALVFHSGPYAPLLEIVQGMECGRAVVELPQDSPTPLDVDAVNKSLLRAIAAADAMLALL